VSARVDGGSSGPSIQSQLARKLRRLAAKILLGLAAFWLLLPPFVYPVRGPITSTFFIRQAPDERIFMSLELHSGLDIAAPHGTVVRAAKSGIVRRAGYSESAGNFVEIRHWLGFSTYYSHLSSISVGDGQFRLKWRPLGRIGSSGRSTGPHLHFEVRWLGFRLPPRPFLLFSGLRHRLADALR
jgi:murein DD-endopeptidase MepM/ murein hydrolase activator NlpD